MKLLISITLPVLPPETCKRLTAQYFCFANVFSDDNVLTKAETVEPLYKAILKIRQEWSEKRSLGEGAHSHGNRKGMTAKKSGVIYMETGRE